MGDTRLKTAGSLVRGFADTRANLPLSDFVRLVQTLGHLVRLGVNATDSATDYFASINGPRLHLNISGPMDLAYPGLKFDQAEITEIYMRPEGNFEIPQDLLPPGVVAVTSVHYWNPLDASFGGMGLTAANAQKVTSFLDRLLTLDLERAQRREALKEAQLASIISEAVQEFRVDEATARALLVEYELKDAAVKHRGNTVFLAMEIVERQRELHERDKSMPLWTLDEAMRYLMSDPLDADTVEELRENGVMFEVVAEDD